MARIRKHASEVALSISAPHTTAPLRPYTDRLAAEARAAQLGARVASLATEGVPHFWVVEEPFRASVGYDCIVRDRFDGHDWAFALLARAEISIGEYRAVLAAWGIEPS